MSRVDLLRKKNPDPYELNKKIIEKLWIDTTNKLNEMAYSIKDNGKIEFDTKDSAIATNATQHLYSVIEYDVKRDTRWKKTAKTPEFDEDALNLIERYRICQIKFGYIMREGDRNNRKYIPKNVNDIRLANNKQPNNIKTYQVRWDNNENILKGYVDENLDNISLRKKECVQKFYYYKYKIEKMAKDSGLNDFNLYNEVVTGRQVIVAEEFFGSGALCTTSRGLFDKAEINSDKKNVKKFRETLEAYINNETQKKIVTTTDLGNKIEDNGVENNKIRLIRVEAPSNPASDTYDDRITVFSYDSINDRIIIKEFYRANVDVSVKYWENYFVFDEKRNYPSKSTKANIFDFIIGIFSVFKNDKSLYLFHYDEKLINNIISGQYGDDLKTPAQKFKTLYENNTGNSDKDYRYILLNQMDNMRKTKNIDDEEKQNVLVHRGGVEYTSSQGCLTIYDGDYGIFQNLFEYGKCGRLFLFRNDFTKI